MERQVGPEIKSALKNAAPKIQQDFYLEIVLPLIFGGRGWYSISDTPTWKWLNSEDGYAQMGFTSRGEPYKLLNAYYGAWFCNVLSDGSISWGFGDVSKLISETIHPAAGTGHLSSNRSWFEWLEGTSEPAYFRKASDARRKGKKGRRGRAGPIAGEAAGVMTKYRKGIWNVPLRYQLDIDNLLDRNERKIQRVLEGLYAKYVLEQFK